MKILMTGAAGFIGYHLTQRLMSEGHTIVGLDNLCNRGDLELKIARLQQLGIAEQEIKDAIPYQSTQGNFIFLKADIMARKALISFCKDEQFDVIIHLAAVTGSEMAREAPTQMFDTNVVGTQNMLEAARVSGVQHFFFASSSVVHGARAKAPLSEDDDVDTPMNMYAGSKRAAELLCYTYSRAFNLPITIFRFFTVYGPWARPDSLPMTIARDVEAGNTITILNNGYLVRDFTYVDDITDGVMSALNNPQYSTHGAPYALYNIGRSKPVPFLSFVQAVESALGKLAKVQLDAASPLTRGESVEVYADTTKLENELAYSPVWDYEEALPIFIEWFRSYYSEKSSH
ncbi:MAG: NAD-dependent epimerase/dehydratase family protein [Akkermansia sp.]|nr:NAD-dependent epimerase/dehydratase family protein [Akkermansia sp.]